jgi:acetyltransferase-like isoleucine patch superfamily enzyme
MNVFDRVLNKIVSYRINNIVFPKEIAKKMPIYCSWHVDWEGIKMNSIRLETDEIYKGMIQIGFDRIAKGLIGGKKSLVITEGDGRIIFKGKADLSQGISLRVTDKAEIVLGSGIYTNGYCSIRSRKKITVGKDNMWGWNVTVMDTDGHPIYNSHKEIINDNKEIVIGDNVWLGSESRVLKGAVVSNGCIVGMGSIVTHKENTENAIIVGSPAKVVKEGIFWGRGDILTH